MKSADTDALIVAYIAAGGQIQEIPAGHQAGLPSASAYIPQYEIAARREQAKAMRHYRENPHSRDKYLSTLRETRT